MSEEVVINIDSVYYAIDVATALEAVFDALLESYSEHDDIESLDKKTVDVTICEEGSGICRSTTITVVAELSEEQIKERLEELIDALLSLAPTLK